MELDNQSFKTSCLISALVVFCIYRNVTDSRVCFKWHGGMAALLWNKVLIEHGGYDDCQQ